MSKSNNESENTSKWRFQGIVFLTLGTIAFFASQFAPIFLTLGIDQIIAIIAMGIALLASLIASKYIKNIEGKNSWKNFGITISYIIIGVLCHINLNTLALLPTGYNVLIASSICLLMLMNHIGLKNFVEFFTFIYTALNLIGNQLLAFGGLIVDKLLEFVVVLDEFGQGISNGFLYIINNNASINEDASTPWKIGYYVGIAIGIIPAKNIEAAKYWQSKIKNDRAKSIELRFSTILGFVMHIIGVLSFLTVKFVQLMLDIIKHLVGEVQDFKYAFKKAAEGTFSAVLGVNDFFKNNPKDGKLSLAGILGFITGIIADIILVLVINPFKAFWVGPKDGAYTSKLKYQAIIYAFIAIMAFAYFMLPGILPESITIIAGMLVIALIAILALIPVATDKNDNNTIPLLSFLIKCLLSAGFAYCLYQKNILGDKCKALISLVIGLGCLLLLSCITQGATNQKSYYKKSLKAPLVKLGAIFNDAIEVKPEETSSKNRK